MNNQNKIVFEGITGHNGLTQTKQRLHQLCKVIGESNVFVNYSELIADVFLPGKKVDPKKLSFVKLEKPDTEALERVIKYARGQKALPRDQKELASTLLEGVKHAAWSNANPHAYAIAACINGLLEAFQNEGVTIEDDTALWNSMTSVVDAYRPELYDTQDVE